MEIWINRLKIMFWQRGCKEDERDKNISVILQVIQEKKGQPAVELKNTRGNGKESLPWKRYTKQK